MPTGLSQREWGGCIAQPIFSRLSQYILPFTFSGRLSRVNQPLQVLLGGEFADRFFGHGWNLAQPIALNNTCLQF